MRVTLLTAFLTALLPANGIGQVEARSVVASDGHSSENSGAYNRSRVHIYQISVRDSG